MLYWALVLPLALAHYKVGPSTNLISGFYRYKAAPFDGPANGMTQYFGLYGINASVTKTIKENPFITQYMIKEDNSGMIVTEQLQEPLVFDLTWNKWFKIFHPLLGKDMDIFASLVSHNTVKIINKIEEDGLIDISIQRFTGAGVQKSARACKHNRNSSYGRYRYKPQVASWTSFEERVDESGKPSPIRLSRVFHY